MSGTAGLLIALLAFGHGAHPRVVAARTHAAPVRTRALALDIRGPAEDATALRATLQELTTRRGLALSFDGAGGDRASRAIEPWATLSVDLDSDGFRAGPALILRQGAAGRVRLQRVVPGGASHQVMIETLATIAYTALEMLALEEVGLERPAPAPRQRPAVSPPRERAEQAAPEPPAAEAPEVDSPPVDAPESPPLATPLRAQEAPSTKQDTDSLALSSRASPPVAADGADAFPVRLSLASFAGYQAGNLFTADRRAGTDAWGMGIAVAGDVPRWPLDPALGLGLGAWYGASHASGSSDGGARTPAGPRLRGQGEVRLTVVRLGGFSASLGPWVMMSRATYDSGPGQLGPRNPGPNQGPPPQAPAPSATGGFSSVTHTEISAGVAARFEASLGERLALYCALAGTTPLTARPSPGGNRQDGGTPNDAGAVPLEAGTRWTLSALAGLSVDLTGERPSF